MAERAREPRYSLTEGAAFVDRPASTVRRWVLGNVRQQGGRTKRDQPLLAVDGDRGAQLPLSFLNLLELRFLGSYRARVPLQSIRHALDYAGSELNVERPLLTVEFRVYGKSLFLKFADEGQDEYLLNASRRGQIAWPSALDEFIQAVDYDEQEKAAYRWWPLGRGRPVVIDTRLNGGLPSTALLGVRTAAIAGQRREGFTAEEIAGDVGATAEEVSAALDFEHVAA